MKEIRVILICLTLSIGCGIITYKTVIKSQNKIAVVDAVRVFDSYNMKKELEAMAAQKLKSDGNRLDSIATVLQTARAIQANEEHMRSLALSYNELKEKLDKDYAESNRDINEQVWKRLNPLLEEYGKSKNINVIIGANGMGTVLYTDSYHDHTNQVIEFINNKYAGNN